MPNLAGALTDDHRSDNALRIGTVTQVNVTSVHVMITGRVLPNIGVLSGYSPAVGDTVAIVRQQAAWVAVGRVGSTTAVGIPIFRGRQTTTGQSIANNIFSAATILTINTEDVDTHGGHDTVTNNTRYTCQEAGWYTLRGGVAWPGNATGRRAHRWLKNGAAIAGSQTQFQPNATGNNHPAASILVSLNIGDYVELQLFQDSTIALTLIVSNESQSYMEAAWTRAL